MVEATLRAGTEERRLVWVSTRSQLAWGTVAADIVAMVIAYLAAVAVRTFVLSATGVPAPRFTLDWSVVVLVVAAVAAFYASGLYELEAYVSRPLHLWTLLKASLVALAVSALSVYVIRADAFDEPRLVLLMTFALFVLLVCIFRLGVLDSLCVAWVRHHRPMSVVFGDSDEALALAGRLSQLRGFDQVERFPAAALDAEMAATLEAAFERRGSADTQAASVFIDSSAASPREVFSAVVAAQAHGAEVYVVSGLFGSLEGNRMLSKLFESPVIRVRRNFDDARPYPLKRAFDLVGSTALLLVFLPVIAVLGVIVRVTSPGPVFHRQIRMGRQGAPFEFLKLRSMVTDGDSSIHAEYVQAFMRGTAEAVATGDGGELVFKMVDDPRITGIGRFIRKYSLDEIPQFWNVFRGDMSLVGPRPPLPYEVSEYDDWHSLRLGIPMGVTGVWQVEGRSRVSFDEMVLQDLMYAQNMRLLLDVELCLRTVPAMLFGGGGG